MINNPQDEQQVEQVGDITVTEGQAKPILHTTDTYGRPRFYEAVIKTWRRKKGRPDDQGKDTFYYSWGFTIVDSGLPPDVGELVLFGPTNEEPRRSFTSGQPLKLLQLIMAVNGGNPPKPGEKIQLDSLIGKHVNVRLENKGQGDQKYQIVKEFYPCIKKGEGQVAVDEDDSYGVAEETVPF